MTSALTSLTVIIQCNQHSREKYKINVILFHTRIFRHKINIYFLLILLFQTVQYMQ